MEALWQDIRYGIRSLAKNPGFAFVAILTLALGIVANTTIFSLVNSVLVRPLNINDPERITALFMQQKDGVPLSKFSIPEYRDIRNQTSEVFSEVLGYQIGLDGLSVNGNAQRIMTSYVTGNFFSTLGINPVLGRFILPTEGETPGADPVMVLSYSFWKSRFGGDLDVVGKSVSLNGHPITIIGVAPQGFYGFSLFDSIQGYLPVSMLSLSQRTGFMENRGFRLLVLRARLQPDVTLQQAQSSLTVVAQRLSQEYPVESKDLSLLVFPEIRARFGDPRTTDIMFGISGLFLGLAVLLLLLACMNVANLLMVRGTRREQEMVIRSALGAERSRLIRQLLTESFLLSVGGGIAGIMLGIVCSTQLSSVSLQTGIPYRFDFSFDWRVFAYGFIVVLISGLATGIVPAFRGSRPNLSNILNEYGRSGGGRRQRLRNALVIAQVGASLMLLIIAGLFTRSLGEAEGAKFGFDPNHVVNLTMDPKQIGYNEAQVRIFYKDLLDRVRALPGVVSASTALNVPMGYYTLTDTPVIEGYEPPAGQPPPLAGFNIVSSDYFKTMRIDLKQGRAFTDADDRTTKNVAIVNKSMAERFWPNEDPIGKRFKRAGDPKNYIEVVGVADDALYTTLESVGPYYYQPFGQRYAPYATLQVRTDANPEMTILEIRKLIVAQAPDLPVFDEMTMTQALYTANGLLIFQVGAGLATSLGLLGLVLAIVGLYGVVSYAAAQRTREIGVRMALGAQPGQILKMVFKQGAFIVGIGLSVGLLATFIVAKIVGNYLIISATDPITYLAVSAVFAFVALLACFMPARRAMRVDPMVALRYD